MLDVGMKVRLELNKQAKPRWQYKADAAGRLFLFDTGYTGHFAEGKVVTITAQNTLRIDCQTFLCEYATVGHGYYDPNQWNLPGFPKEIAIKPPEKVCTCGAWATYGKMQCPGHGTRCDLYTPNPYTGL